MFSGAETHSMEVDSGEFVKYILANTFAIEFTSLSVRRDEAVDQLPDFLLERAMVLVRRKFPGQPSKKKIAGHKN